MYIGDGTVRAMDSVSSDREAENVVLKDDIDFPFEVPPSTEALEGVPLHDAKARTRGPYVEVSGAVRRDELSSSRPADVPFSSADGKDKGVAKDGYETGSDLDVDEVRIMSEGFTRVEVRLEGSTQTIAIPMDRDLLVNAESVAPFLGPLFSNLEGRTLEELDDATLSRSITGLALRVSFLTFLSNFMHFGCLHLFFRL